MRALSLCSGIGGLDRAVEEVFGAELVAYAEVDKDASRVMARHWPGVPNLGDLKTANWEPWAGVDIVCGGWPCQPSSSAGKRKGRDDERWLWPEVARCLRVLRPCIFIGENVPGLLTVDDGLGFNEVVSDLAALGLSAEWGSVSASSVGACHRRERLFLVAYAHRERLAGWTQPDERTLEPGLGAPRRPDADGLGVGVGEGLTLLPTPAAGNFNDGEDPESWLARRDELKARGINGNGAGTPLAVAVKMLPTPTTSDGNGGGDHGEGSADLRTVAATLEPVPLPEFSPAHGDARARMPDRWGDYAAAIARHELVFGRPAPAPLEGKRLSPDFVSWMMDFPPGWCDGLSRTAQLRCLGNAVVTRQAIAALELLLERATEAAA